LSVFSFFALIDTEESISNICENPFQSRPDNQNFLSLPILAVGT
jgi:hypothetical protein